MVEPVDVYAMIIEDYLRRIAVRMILGDIISDVFRTGQNKDRMFHLFMHGSRAFIDPLGVLTLDIMSMAREAERDIKYSGYGKGASCREGRPVRMQMIYSFSFHYAPEVDGLRQNAERTD
jgi:hypothetical protein